MVTWLPSRRDTWLTNPDSPGLFDLDQLSVETVEEGRTMSRENAVCHWNETRTTQPVIAFSPQHAHTQSDKTLAKTPRGNLPAEVYK